MSSSHNRCDPRIQEKNGDVEVEQEKSKAGTDENLQVALKPESNKMKGTVEIETMT